MIFGKTMPTPATDFQKDLAHRLGIAIDETSFAVASAQLAVILAPAIWQKPDSGPATSKQVAYAATLCIDVSGDAKRVASARIQVRQDERNRKLIDEMGLAAGVVVFSNEHHREMVISSIASNGRLWFKGGNGSGAFPHQVEMVPKSTK